MVSSLASEQVAFVSGATFSVNGGQHMVRVREEVNETEECHARGK